jgi:hypothetical protein
VVTRQLNDLEQEGVIRVGRGVIEITDLARLRAMDQEASGRFVYRPQE